MPRRAASKYLGKFDLGTRAAEVWIDWKQGSAQFWFVDNEARSRIVIGIISEYFEDVLSNAMHEATEMVYGEMGLRYSPRPEIGNDNGAYFFAMTHTQFSEATARVALFMKHLYPELKKEHDKFHAKTKSNRRS
jgi:hypothetical protein